MLSRTLARICDRGLCVRGEGRAVRLAGGLLRKDGVTGYESAMSLESVRTFFSEKAPDIAVLVTEQSSATVTLAAEAHGVAPAQIAKTICLRIGDEIVLLVAAGTARLSNRKFKDRFAAKPRMLDAEQVLAITSHPVGGVCPFGLPAPVPVYCDVSLKPFEEVVPAAGATNAAVRIAPDHMARLVNGEWVDVCE
jgi:prolyl-tRNA editing enzyme YbaK/EbsC (Cys-tRNA(Pro) deacylase)